MIAFTKNIIPKHMFLYLDSIMYIINRKQNVEGYYRIKNLHDNSIALVEEINMEYVPKLNKNGSVDFFYAEYHQTNKNRVFNLEDDDVTVFDLDYDLDRLN